MSIILPPPLNREILFGAVGSDDAHSGGAVAFSCRAVMTRTVVKL